MSKLNGYRDRLYLLLGLLEVWHPWLRTNAPKALMMIVPGVLMNVWLFPSMQGLMVVASGVLVTLAAGLFALTCFTPRLVKGYRHSLSKDMRHYYDCCVGLAPECQAAPAVPAPKHV